MKDYNIIVLDDNFIQAGYPKGSQNKVDLINISTNQTLMFKEPKEGLGDNWSEKIASELGKEIEIKVQSVELGIRDGKIGALIEYSYDRNTEKLVEGWELLKEEYPDFDVLANPGYVFEKIEIVLKKYSEEILNDFIDLLFFDALIGNTDRHCENWGIIEKNTLSGYEKTRLIAAYDNSASLGRELHEDEGRIKLLLTNENQFERFLRRCNSKIRWESERRINHFDFFEKIIEKFPGKKEKYLQKLKFLSDEKIENIIMKVPEVAMCELMKIVLKKIIKERRDRIKILLKK